MKIYIVVNNAGIINAVVKNRESVRVYLHKAGYYVGEFLDNYAPYYVKFKGDVLPISAGYIIGKVVLDIRP